MTQNKEQSHQTICPNCGAPREDPFVVRCKYCGSVFESWEYAPPQNIGRLNITPADILMFIGIFFLSIGGVFGIIAIFAGIVGYSLIGSILPALGFFILSCGMPVAIGILLLRTSSRLKNNKQL